MKRCVALAMTDRIPSMRLRLLTEDDLTMILGWRNDELVRRHMFNRQIIAADQHRVWYERVRCDPVRRLFVFELAGVPSGFVNFHPVARGGIAEWGFYRAPDASRGSGRLLGRTALDHAFAELGLHKVCGRVLRENSSSIRMHEALGFRCEGILREHHRSDEDYHDVLAFGLLARDWCHRTDEISNA